MEPDPSIPQGLKQIEDTIEQAVPIPPGLKSGFKTTEFWITLLCMIGGFVLLWKDKEGPATILLTVAGVSYSGARALVKRAHAVAILLVFSLLFTGCGTAGYVKASAIDELTTAVCDRHDAYVKADTTLDPQKRESELRSSALLKQTIAEAKKVAEKPPATTDAATTRSQ